MTMSITSTTDTPEAVTAAMGDLAEVKPVEEIKEAKDEVKAEKESEAGEEAEPKEEEKAETSEEPDEEETEAEELETKDDETLKPKKKGGFQKKLERAEKLRVTLEQEKEYWRNEALRTKTPAETISEIKPDFSKKPNADDFKTVAEYEDAVFDWKYEQKRSKEIAKEKDAAVKNNVQTQIAVHQARVAEFSKSKDDWDDVIEAVGKAPLSITVQEAILNSDSGPAIMYELAKDPKELRRICELTPIQAAMALGKIEARVTKSDSSIETKLTTKAPTPIKPVRSKGSTSETGYRDDMSLREYEKWRNDQLKAKRAGA